MIVVDGSEPAVCARNAGIWPRGVRHVRPEGTTANPKVASVVTGLRLARAAGLDRCVVADDDVRYERRELAAMAAALSRAEVVRPQNYFDPTPWHALEDTARSLLNRACGTDHPGTLGVRAAALADGYDGDVLFENLELVRTVTARGGREVRRPDIYVRRLPPTTRHFLGQRVRQAYDSQAQPVRLAAELALLPAAIAASRRPTLLGAAFVGAVVLAEAGRRRAGGRRYFSAVAAFWAPVWLGERAVCSWLALGCRLRGGVPYRGRRLSVAAHSMRELRRRAAARAARPGLVGAVAEGLDRRPAAPAERDGAPLALHDGAVGVADLEVAAEQERSVGVCGEDGRRLAGKVGRHAGTPGHSASVPGHGHEESSAGGER